MAKEVIIRAKVQDDGWTSKLNSMKKSMKDLKSESSSFGSVFKKGVAAAGAYTAALVGINSASAIFNKAISSSQSATDGLGRTMQGSTRIIDTFFERLSAGSFNSFLEGLDKIVEKARSAYDAVDMLGTFEIMSDPQFAKIEMEIATAKNNIRKGIDVDANKEIIRQQEEKRKALMETQSKRLAQAGDALLESYTNSDFVKYGYKKYAIEGETGQDDAKKEAERLKAKYSTTEFQNTYSNSIAGGSSGGYVTTWYDEDARHRYNALMAFAEMPDEKLKEVTSNYSSALRTKAKIQNAEFSEQEILNYKGGVGNKSSSRRQEDYQPSLELSDIEIMKWSPVTSMSDLTRQLSEAKKRVEEATNSFELASAEKEVSDLTARIEAQPIALRVDINERDVANIMQNMSDLSDKIHADFSKIDFSLGEVDIIKPLEQADKNIKDISFGVQGSIAAFGQLGGVMQGIEDPSIQVAGIIMQAVANVAGSFAKSLSGTATPWDWIAAAIAGTATMITTISSIKSATAGSYADGGVVGGNRYMGDAIPVMANAGEVILNASQQQTLASQLEARQDRSFGGHSYISGEQIVTVINAYGRRTNKGEILK